MLVVDMCPDALRKHLKENEYRLKTNSKGDNDKFYDLIRVEINDWLVDHAGESGGRAAALEPAAEEPSAEDETPWPEEDDWGEVDPATLTDGQLRALVKNKFEKRKGKGEGKSAGEGAGGGKSMEVDHSGKTRYDCG